MIHKLPHFPADLQIILASASPRRKALVEEMGFDVIVKPTNIDEHFDEKMKPAEVPVFLAEKKALAYLDGIGANQVVLSADTVVVCNRTILNKPADEDEAAAMLTLLSGHLHTVITGVCLRWTDQLIKFSATSKVYFNALSEAEIAYYIHQFKPYDKAGAYGIQEWIGLVGIQKIIGSYTNIVGLPTEMVYREMLNYYVSK